MVVVDVVVVVVVVVVDVINVVVVVFVDVEVVVLVVIAFSRVVFDAVSPILAALASEKANSKLTVFGNLLN